LKEQGNFKDITHNSHNSKQNHKNNHNNNGNHPTKSNYQDDSSDDDSQSPSNGLTSLCETLSSRNIRVAVVGNVDAGKSTLIGTLTTSSLDDGRGSSRTAIMKHRHKIIETGRTSTATTHLLGYRHSGEPISGRDTIRINKRKSEDEIAR
jgi:ribosome biogenesis GTPase A